MKRIKLVMAAALLAVSSLTQASAPLDFNEKDVLEALKRSYVVHNSDLMFLDVNGEVYMGTTNGRFLFRPRTGAIYDLWYKRRIESVSDLPDVNRLHIDKLPFNVEALNVVSMGKMGAKKVYIWLDPAGPANKKLFEQMQPLLDSYEFKLIIAPSSYGNSQAFTEALACNDNPEQARAALLTQDMTSLRPSQNASCRTKVLVQTATLTSVLRLTQLPTIISPDGEISVGVPEDLIKTIQGQTQ